MNWVNKTKKMILVIAIVLFISVLVGCKEDDKPKVDPTPSIEKNILTGFTVITEKPVIEDKVEFAVYETITNYITSKYNPYDYNQIDVYAEITSPSNVITKVYGFWYRDYEIDINEKYTGTITGVSGTASKDPSEIQGLEQVKWKNDDYHFRFRFTPTEIGTHKVVIKVLEETKLVQTISNQVLVDNNTDSNYRGIIEINQSNERHFIDQDGNTFIPNGINLCWWTNSNRKTYDYDVWFDNLSSNGGNFARIWMATWGFCQHWSSIDNYNSSQNMAARLDRVMEVADEYGIYLQLCLLNHGQFSSNTNSEWAKNPYNEKNGGMLSTPNQFFSNSDAKTIYKMELRYIIARYSYSDKLLAWELFNEVDWTDGGDSYNMINIRNWHQEMAKFVKENDPYNHLITTSYKSINSSKNLAFNLSEIDFASVHSYDFANTNINKKLPSELTAVINKYKKPVHTGEIGIDWQSGYSAANSDPNGISIRQSLWAGMMCGSVGGAMQWWWDSWIHPNKLWYLFAGAGKYSSKMNLDGADYELLNSENSNLSLSTTGILGYKFSNRIYGYIYNSNWTYYSNSTTNILNLTTTVNLSNGSYKLAFYNTVTGEIISSQTITVTNNTYKVSVPTFTEDIAFIID